MTGIVKAAALAAQWWLMAILIPVAIWYWGLEVVCDDEAIQSAFIPVAFLICLCAPFGSLQAVVRWLERH